MAGDVTSGVVSLLIPVRVLQAGEYEITIEIEPGQPRFAARFQVIPSPR
jgi:hypothetical protein